MASPALTPQERAEDARALLALARLQAGLTAEPLSAQRQEALWSEARRHGMVSGVAAAIRFTGGTAPAFQAEVRRHHLAEQAKMAVAMTQMQELATTLSARGIDVVFLKGAAAIAWLCREAQGREIADIDFLIRRRDQAGLEAALESLRYDALAAYSSPDDEQASAVLVGLSPRVRAGGIPLEPHLGVLGEAGDNALFSQGLWQRAARLPNGLGLRPGNADFLIHGAVHYEKHLIHEGFAPLKWLIDLALVMSSDPNAAVEAQRIAPAVGVGEGVNRVINTVRAHFLDAAEAHPMHDSITVTFGAPPVRNARDYYRQRLAAIRELNAWPERLRYLRDLIWPSEPTLRYRYPTAKEPASSLRLRRARDIARRWLYRR